MESECRSYRSFDFLPGVQKKIKESDGDSVNLRKLQAIRQSLQLGTITVLRRLPKPEPSVEGGSGSIHRRLLTLLALHRAASGCREGPTYGGSGFGLVNRLHRKWSRCYIAAAGEPEMQSINE